MIMKKSLIMILIGATVLGMVTMSVSADIEDEHPDAAITHDASNGEKSLEEPIIAPASDEDGKIIIAPNPTTVHTEDAPYWENDQDIIAPAPDRTEVEQENQPVIIMPYDTNEFIGITDENEETNTQNAGTSVLGPLGLVGLLGCVIVTKRRK